MCLPINNSADKFFCRYTYFCKEISLEIRFICLQINLSADRYFPLAFVNVDGKLLSLLCLQDGAQPECHNTLSSGLVLPFACS